MPAWTEAELATMERLARKGASASSIAASIGRSQMAVYKMAEKTGVQLRGSRRWTEADDRALIETIGSGEKASDAARRLGRTRDAVLCRMHSLGVSSRACRRYDWEAVEEMLAAGVPTEDAAASQGTTRRRLDEAMRSRTGRSYTNMLRDMDG